MIEKKLDFDSYVRFAQEGERHALVYLSGYSAYRYLQNKYTITHRFPFLNAVAIEGGLSEVRRLSCSPYVEFITAQSKVFTLEKSSLPQAFLETAIEAPATYALGLKTDLTGNGTTLAVMDTGIQPHVDLACPIFRVKEFYDVYGGEYPYDDNGHGTFVSGVAVGNGCASGRRVCGVAPNADLVGVKVISDTGECGAFRVLEGMQWLVDNFKRLGVSVVCMSFGSTPLSSNDPLAMGAEILVKNGLTVVCAAGNSGKDGLKSPAISSEVIAVGAVDEALREAEFSSRGSWFGHSRPDVYARGVGVNGLHYRGCYTKMSGTSVAAPYVAGAACLLHERFSGLSPRETKAIIMRSAEFFDGKRVLRFD